jgi:Ion transport protein/Cyclic nucleotide-binding domain
MNLQNNQTKIFGESLRSWRYRFIISPESPSRFSWEIFIGLILLVLGFMIPYISAFEPDNTSLSGSIDILSLTIFSLDMTFNFNTGYYEDGTIIKDRLKILINYLKFWFWVDLLSTIPIDWILNSLGSKSSNKNLLIFTKFLRVFKLFKLVRLAKLRVLIFRIEDQIANQSIISLITILKLLLYLLLLAHFFACMMFYISSANLNPNSFITRIEYESDELNISTLQLYVSSLYWAFVTMTSIGYGDITPGSTNERIFCILTMLTSSVVFGVVIGNIGGIIEKSSISEKERRDVLVTLNSFAKANKLSKDIANKARRYLDYSYHYEKFNESNLGELLSNLSQPLQEEVLLYTNGKVLNDCKVFKIFHNGYIHRLSKVMKIEIFSPMDSIIREGQRPHGMYFILKHSVEICDKKTSSRIKILSNDGYFGEIGLFTSKNCVSSALAMDFVECLLLSCSDFEYILSITPNLKTIVDDIRESCSQGDYTSLNVYCYTCKCLGHIAKHCQAIINEESTKKNWLNRIKFTKLVSPNKYYGKKPRKTRVKVKRPDYSIRNVVGTKRASINIFPENKKLSRKAKVYFKSNIIPNEGTICLTEDSINTSTFQIIRPELILSSSSDD